MKVTVSFEADSLAKLRSQLMDAYKTISYGVDGGQPGIAAGVAEFEKEECDTHSGMALDKLAAPTVYGSPGVPFPPLTTTGVEAAPQVTSQPFAMPDSNGNVPAGTQKDHIDGYTVSDGKVWVPVGGRASAFAGVEVDEYLRRKNAAGELDTEGKAWDASIHASTKTKTVKGVWKKKKQFGDKEETVEQAQPAQAVAAPQEMPQFEQSSAPIGRAPEMHNYESFKKNLQMILVRLHTAGKIDRPYMAELTKWAEVTNLWEVTKNEEKTKQLFDLFVQNQYIIGV